MAVPLSEAHTNGTPMPLVKSEKADQNPLHRLATVRCQQGLSQRSVARQMGKEVGFVKAQERDSSDLRLSDIYEWQQVLEVPVADLLVDPGTPLSRPVLERARLVRLMKSAMAILERAQSPAIKRLGERMVNQLVEIMPELKEVGSWHAVGQRRSMEDLGRVVEQSISDDVFHHAPWRE